MEKLHFTSLENPNEKKKGVLFRKIQHTALACIAAWTLSPEAYSQQDIDTSLPYVLEKLDTIEHTTTLPTSDISAFAVYEPSPEELKKFEVITEQFLTQLSLGLASHYHVPNEDMREILNDIHASCGSPTIVGHKLPNIRSFEGGPLNIIFISSDTYDVEDQLHAYLGELSHARQFKDHPYRSSLLALLSYGRAGVLTCVKRDDKNSFLQELQEHYTDFAYDEKTGSKIVDIFSALEREAHEKIEPELWRELEMRVQAVQK